MQLFYKLDKQFKLNYSILSIIWLMNQDKIN